MNKKKKKLLFLLGVLLLIAAAYMDLSTYFGTVSGKLERNKAGQGDQTEDFLLKAESMEDGTEYEVTIPELELTGEETEEMLLKARQEIADTVFSEADDPEMITGDLLIEDRYADGFVEAEWTFSSEEGTFFRADGELRDDAVIPEDGALVTANVHLTCQNREEDYVFSFLLYPHQKSKEELLFEKINRKIQESANQGKTFIQLPDQVDGQKLKWRKACSFYFLKFLCLEVITLVLFVLSEAENKKIRQKSRRESLELELPAILQKLSLMIGSGMSIRRAWYSIAERYEEELKAGKRQRKVSYDEMVKVMHQIKEGMSESSAYRDFGQLCGIPSYYRLAGLLVQGLEKGNREICDALEREAEESFEKRRILVTQKGEEAGTRMLFPLLGMMVIVIAIVMVPAFMSFQF